MKKVTILEAEKQVYSMMEQENFPLTCFLFYESACESCNTFIEIFVPEIKAMGVEVYAIDLRESFMPFPPASTPTTYWYMIKERPPMVKKGLPPAVNLIKQEIERMIAVNKGLLTIEQAFF